MEDVDNCIFQNEYGLNGGLRLTLALLEEPTEPTLYG